MVYVGVVWLCLCFCHLVSAPVINEIMADPAGPETGEGSPGDRNEYVELFNPGPRPVSLEGFALSDRNEIDVLVPFQGSTQPVLGPGAYALILDSEYFDEGGSDPQPYDIPEATLLLTTEDRDIGGYGLSSRDWLILLDPSGDTVDTYGTPWDSLDALPPEAEDGVSIERRVAEGGDEAGNWRKSRFRCTPGRQNSVSMPVNLALDSALHAFEPELPLPGDSIRLSVAVLNAGLEDVSYFSLHVQTGLEEDERDLFEVLHPDDTTNVCLSLAPLSEGEWEIRVSVSHPRDTCPKDDSLELFLLVGRPPVVVNEIMYDGAPEWVELYNRSNEDIDLCGFVLEDKAGSATDAFGPFLLHPGGFVVVTSDTPALAERFGAVPCLSTPQFPTLNNSEEELELRNGRGGLLEKVVYRSRFGGGKGISLERISPELPPGLEASWAGSLDPSGATPGRRNSVYVESRREEDLLQLSSKIFTPNDDGDEDVLVISYLVPEFPAWVQLCIFDATGRLVKSLDRSRSSSGKGQAVWTGKGDSNQALPTGLYIVYLEARAGARTFKAKRTVALRR